MIINARGAGWLDNIDVGGTNVFMNLNADLTVREFLNGHIPPSGS